MSYRIERVNHLLRRELSELIQHQLKDPRIDTFVTVTEVETSADLKYAKVFISSIRGQEEQEKLLGVLTSARGHLRRELMKNVELRHIPDLSFHWDNSIEHGDRILRLIDEVIGDKDTEDNPPNTL